MLSFLPNKYAANSIFPVSFKLANITPVFKICFRIFFQKYFTHHCLLLMIQKWKKAVDNKKAFGALLTGLSKAFDCISHDLVTAKLHACRLSFNRKQKTKVGIAYSNRQDILAGAPQGPILGPNLFNVVGVNTAYLVY